MRHGFLKPAVVLVVAVFGGAAFCASGGEMVVGPYDVKPAPEFKGVYVAEGDFGHDGATEVRVENQFFRLIIAPDVGGEIGSLVLKKYGNDLTTRPTAEIWGGLCQERVGVPNSSEWRRQCKYAIEKTPASAGKPDRVTVTLTSTGKSGVLAHLTLRKRITVQADSARIDVDYELLNDAASETPLVTNLRFWNMPGAPARGSSIFFPLDTGVFHFDLGKLGGNDATLREPARGWAASLVEKDRTGVAARFDYRYISCFYTWFNTAGYPTVEWWFLPQKIEPGESFKTHESFLPFAGLSKVDGASADAAGSLTIAAQPAAAGKPERNKPAAIEAQFCVARAGEAKVLLRARRLPDKTWTEIAKKSVALTPVEAVKQDFTWTPSEDGTYVIQAVIEVPGAEPCTIEQPVSVGKPTAGYEMERECERVSAEPIFDPRKVDISYTSREVVTPHVEWAVPYAGGRTAVAFFLGGTQACREVVELAERFDLSPSASLGSFVNPQYDSGTYYLKLDASLVKSKYNALLSPERSYDALVFSGSDWDQLTDFSKSRVRDMVQNGAGLIWINPTTDDPRALEMLPAAKRGAKAASGAWAAEGDHYITRALPFAAMPATRRYDYGQVTGQIIAKAGGAPLIVIGDYGKGRVVLLNYVAAEEKADGLLPREHVYPKIQYPYWEYQYGLIGRAILWTTHREPTIQIVAATPPESLSAESCAGKEIKLRVTSDADARVELEVRFLDQYGEPLASATQPASLHSGSNELKVTLPALPDGMNLAHFILKTTKGAADWRAVALPTESPAKIVDVKLSKDSYDRSENVRAEITLTAKTADAPLRLEARLADGYGRILAVQDIPAAARAKLSVEFPLTCAISTRGILDFRLLRDKTLLDRRLEKFVVRPSRTWDDYESVIWAGGPDGGHESLFDARMKVMRDGMGMSGIVLNPGDYVPAWLAAFLDNSVKIVTKASGQDSAKYAAILNMLGDEQAVAEIKPGDLAGIARVREWLKTKYPDVQKLNAEWGTDFKTWDDVKPMLTLEEAQARNQKTGTMNFAPWADYRAYLDSFFTDGMRRAAEALVAGDPQAREAVSGTQPAATRSGNNWWQLTRVFKGLMNYDQYRLLRSFSDMPLTPWFGYGGKGTPLQAACWESLFAGCTGCGAWHEGTFAEPDYTLFQGAKDMQAAVMQIRRGPGKLLISSLQHFDPIAFHYSQDSIHAAFALKRESALQSARDGMIAALVALGYQPRFLAYEQIEGGALSVENTKVFFMPHSFALSAKEAEQIRAFVKSGGTVVADILPAVMDEHCRALPQGQLDDVFGVTRKEIKLSSEPLSLSRLSPIPFAAEACEISLEPTTATTRVEFSGTPGILVNSFGKGKAIYINGDVFSRYASLAAARKKRSAGAQAGAIEQLMEDIVSAAGCAPRIRIADADGKPLRSCPIYTFDAGGSVFIGMVAGAGEEKQTVTLSFTREAYAYDVLAGLPAGLPDGTRAGEAFGKTSSLKTEIGPETVHLFALLPYKVTGIEFKCNAVCPRGEVLRAAVSIQSDGLPAAAVKPDLHVVRMQVFDPAGREVEYYAANLLLKEGKGEAVIPFALNDAVGKWTVRLRDVATGIRSENVVEVQ